MKIIIFCALALFACTPMIAQQSSNLNSFNFSENVLISNLEFSSLPTKINSENNEIAVGRFRDKFLILSDKRYQHAKVVKDNSTQRKIPNTLCVEIYYDNDLKYPNLFSRLLQSERNEGYMTFNDAYNVVYFTRKKNVNSDLFYLFKSNLTDENKGIWSTPEEVLIDGESIAIRTPRLGTNNSTLYFSANLKDSYGGYDIYKAEITESGVQYVQNLGPEVNTISDELAPVEFENQLFYSSNQKGGFGGFDIYRISNITKNPTHKINLGSKLNTADDEINFIPTTANTGYYTTNNSSTDKSFNIYRYIITHKDITIESVFMDKDNKRIKDLNVSVYNENNTLILEGKTNSDGILDIVALPYSKLNYVIHSNTYINNEALTYKVNNQTDLQYVAFTLDELTIDNEIKKTLFLTEEYIIYFDFDDYQIKESEKQKINKLIDTMHQNKQVSFVIEGHTDNKGSKKYNVELSKKRAESVQKYLLDKGVTNNKIKALGEESPSVKCTDCTQSQDALNRRVVFIME